MDVGERADLEVSSIWNVVTFACLIATYFRLDIQHIGHDAKVATLKNIDYIGMLLLIAGVSLL